MEEGRDRRREQDGDGGGKDGRREGGGRERGGWAQAKAPVEVGDRIQI